MPEQHALFDPVLRDLSDRSRDEVLAAFSAVQYSANPSPRSSSPACATSRSGARSRRCSR